MNCPKEWLKFFKAVCDPNRQKILNFIHEEGEVNASKIVKKMKLSQPTISHHLKILCDAGIIISKKKQKEVYYTISKKNIANCCKGFMKFFRCGCK
jgi:ArsR family transcriptional regulator, arsenate/arsenite/antimonite-responsive transcriptional repressor